MKIKLTATYASIGALLAGADLYAGMVILKNAESRAEEMVRACRHNKAAWGWLERIVNSSDVGSLIFGHGLMIYAILVHAGRIKGDVNTLAPFGLSEQQVLGTPMSEEHGIGAFTRSQ